MASPNLQIENGNFQDSEGNVLNLGYLLFELSHDSNYVAGPAQIVAGIKFRVNLNSSGSVPASPATMIYSNDVLTPAGSYYIVRAFKADGTEAWASPQNFIFAASPNPLDLGTVVPSNPPGSGLGGSSGITLETNGSANSNQALLNLTGGTGVTVSNSAGTTTIAATGADISTNKFVYWVPGNATGAGDWVVTNDFKGVSDSGATAGFQAPTSTTNYTITLTGNRIVNGLFSFYGGRNFTFKAAGGVTTGTLGHSSIGLADSASWFGGLGGTGLPTGNIVMFDASGSTWNCLVGNGTTTTASTSVSTTTRHTFEIDYTSTSVVFKIDGTTVATVTTNIPTTAAMGVIFNSFHSGAGQTFTGEYMYCTQAWV